MTSNIKQSKGLESIKPCENLELIACKKKLIESEKLISGLLKSKKKQKNLPKIEINDICDTNTFGITLSTPSGNTVIDLLPQKNTYIENSFCSDENESEINTVSNKKTKKVSKNFDKNFNSYNKESKITDYDQNYLLPNLQEINCTKGINIDKIQFYEEHDDLAYKLLDTPRQPDPITLKNGMPVNIKPSSDEVLIEKTKYIKMYYNKE